MRQKGDGYVEKHRLVGTVIRILRLQRNWSQETLCHGICAVSYLSKIEQGKVEVNENLLKELFGRLGATWQASAEIGRLRDDLYESTFSWDDALAREKMAVLEENWDQWVIGPCYADFLVIRAYHYRNTELVPREIEQLLEPRQKALLAIVKNHHDEAYRLFPCALTAFCVGEQAYCEGNYTQALESFQIACDQAAREGYVYLLMYGQHYMANCYSDMGNLDAMYRHGKIAARLGRILGDQSLVDTVDYNIAATKAGFGDYEGAYAFFSGLKSPGIMDLHKLAVCCEALGKIQEAAYALDRADEMEPRIPLEKEMCALVRYRLEHQDYLHDTVYGQLLMDAYDRIKKELPAGFARFHLPWVTEWLTANRQYRKAYEILHCFPKNGV